MTFQVHQPTDSIDTKHLTWYAHPSFDGVQMADVLTANHTDNTFSMHLVKVAANKALLRHTHPTNWETHHVLEGYGTCSLGQREVTYAPNVTSSIPRDCSHEVTAGPEGLLIEAVFTPALK